MSDDERDDDEPGTKAEPAGGEPGKRKRGRPRGSGGGARKHVSTRFERRAAKAETTVREIVRLGKPDLDVEGLTFAEVVERDAPAWGRFVAQLGEWIVPFGAFVDLVFGSPFVVLLNMAPTVRAARRDLTSRRERRAAERQREADELAELDEPEPEPPVRSIFDPPPAEPEPPAGMTRDEWLASGGIGGE